MSARKFAARGIVAISVAALTMAVMPYASANHAVLVEGEQDYDGDTLIGQAEDNDNATDRVFGTITAALGAANGGAGQNGRVTIVTSGRFFESVTIAPTTGNVTLEAAPGVEANVEAVAVGDRVNDFPGPPNPTTLQALPGIIVNGADNTYVTIRNIVTRNWTRGVQINGPSHVTLDNVRAENNINYGVRAGGTSKTVIVNSQVQASGFRTTSTGPSTPNPGIGVEYGGRARGRVAYTTISGSFGKGLNNESRFDLQRGPGLILFDNNRG